MESLSLTTLTYKFVTPNIVHVEFNRAQKLNSMTSQFFEELNTLFTTLNKLPELRVVILTGSGKCFTAGLDLFEAASVTNFDEDLDQARKSIRIYNLIKKWQDDLNSIIKLKVPVLVGIHNYCIGGGVDLITGCDIRYCTEDAKFSIKEIDIGMCADIGTFPRINQIIGNDSLIRELAFTGRVLDSQEALKYGLVSRVFKDKDEMVKEMIKVAENISSKSPVGIYTIKKVLNGLRRENMEKGLEYVALMNHTMILTNDVAEAVNANLSKGIAKFSKL